jgi:hypothetical protein
MISDLPEDDDSKHQLREEKMVFAVKTNFTACEAHEE